MSIETDLLQAARCEDLVYDVYRQRICQGKDTDSER